MFGLFKADPYDDRTLGRLERRRGYWRGRIALSGSGEVDLAITGGRSGPDADCLALIRAFPDAYARLRPQIAERLAEHRDDGPENSETQRPADASYVWDKVRVLGVAAQRWSDIAPRDSNKSPVAVVEYQTEWDIEHTLGAVIDGDKLVELNGSVMSVF